MITSDFLLPNPFHCMLAANIPANEAELPVGIPFGNFYGTLKADGVRGFTHPTLGACCRSNKPIPNRALRALLANKALVGLDYEIIHGDPCDENSFSNSTSAVMTEAGPKSGFYIHVFDDFSLPNAPYTSRLRIAEQKVGSLWIPGLSISTSMPIEISTRESLDNYHDRAVAKGWEGLVLRHKSKPYKFGRSTFREFGMVRYCRETTLEAEIIGFDEQMWNCNEAVLNERGYTQRSSAAAGLVPKGMLGAFICKNPLQASAEAPATFKIGTMTGLTDAKRQEIWAKREAYVGKLIKFKYKDCGSQDRPRQPIGIGFRDRADLE